MFVKRDIFTDAQSTASSFKSWDTCMANTGCKVIAIIGIVLASLVALWILTTIFRCCFYGLACTEACCGLCCCRSRSNRQQNYQQPQPIYQQPEPVYQQPHVPTYTKSEKIHPYDNVNMYPPKNPPYYEANSDYRYSPQVVPQQAHTTNYQGYQPVDSRENPFEQNGGYRGNF